MKVALGARLKDGPWGGGNQFGAALARHLRAKGHTVCADLGADDIDVILMTDPRWHSTSSAFNDIDILQYLDAVNPRVVVVHRVNECDAGRNTKLRDPRLAVANRCADHTIFISQWLRDYFSARRHRFAEPSVIRNGADSLLFNPNDAAVWTPGEPIRLVSHHWSDNWMKGFDIYILLDRLLGRAPFRNLFAFTYIGRLPSGVTLPNSRCLAPLYGAELASALRQNHAYLTAARNEGAGMHHIEGAMCGLPILYLDNGALTEYCTGFGVSFRPWTFEAGLMFLRDNFARHRARMSEYPNTAERMCGEYIALFQDLLARGGELVQARAQTRAHASGLIVRARVLDTISRVALSAQSLGRWRRGSS